jgi:hypothetical protein
MKFLYLLGMSITLSACVAATETYAPDGRKAYNIDCSLTNWGQCRQKAGQICGSLGYEIVAQDGEQGYVESSTAHSDMNANAAGANAAGLSSSIGSTSFARTMTVVCKE